MIIGTPDGKYYSQYWGKQDNFNKMRLREITQRYVAHTCEKSQDYVKFRRLTLKERLAVENKPPQDVTWK